MRAGLQVVALVLLAAAACERRAAPLCVEGATAACACIGNLSGVQTCQHDGTFGVCVCTSATVRVDDPDESPPVILSPESPMPAPPRFVPPAPLRLEQPVLIVPPPLPRPPRPAPPDTSPMGRARTCLRNNSSNMAAGNACVVQVLRGRASTESELGLLAVTYRTMGRTSDAVRAMRTYIARFPDGPRVAGFQQYIDSNGH